MSRGSCGQLEWTQRCGFRPVELRDASRSDTPSLQVRADAEWNDESRARLLRAPRQCAHDAAVEVIVVIVRSDNCVERWKFVKSERRLVEPLRANERRRRGAPRPNGVEENARAVDLDKHSRVAEPCRAQSGRGRLCEARFRQ